MKLNPQSFNRSLPLDVLKQQLRTNGCSGCALGEQKKLIGPVLYRGNPKAQIMCVGEGPGLKEDELGETFVGPAGKKLDEIFKYIGIDTNNQCFLGNVVDCRPIAPSGSGKQNLPPKSEYVTACRPYLLHQIEVINPSIIVAVGMQGLKGLFPNKIKSGDPLLKYVGQFFWSSYNKPVYIIYHPSALLRSQGDQEKSLFYRKKMVEHIDRFKEVMINQDGINHPERVREICQTTLL